MSKGPPKNPISLRRRLAAERRVHAFLLSRRYLFAVDTGEHGTVRIVPMAISDAHGAGLIGNEYDQILRDLVEAALGQ